MVLGFVGTIVVCKVTGFEEDFNDILIMAILFAGVPYGWVLMNSFIDIVLGGTEFVISVPLWLTAMVFKLVAAAILGWIVTPIALVYNIIMAIVKRNDSYIEYDE